MNDRGAIDTRAGRRAPVTGEAGFLDSYVCEHVVMEIAFFRDADFPGGAATSTNRACRCSTACATRSVVAQ